MITLDSLVEEVDILQSKGPLKREVREIQQDSREVGQDDVFVAVKGTRTDGHRYIGQAVDRGAQAIVCEEWTDDLSPGISCIQVENSSIALGKMLSVYYGHPSRKIKLIGVTGTNGKTTVVLLGYRLFNRLGKSSGLFSTIEYRVGKKKKEATHTTPDIKTLQKTLAEMVEEGCEYAFMEVSSHAVHQDRIAGLRFAGGIFTNLTHEHLDYHGTFKAYRDAKKKFFDNLDNRAFALTNTDDKNGRYMVQNTGASVYTYGLRGGAEYRGKILDNSLEGLHMEVDGTEVHFRLIGAFNAYNLLAVYATAVLVTQAPSKVLRHLSALGGAPGRFEQVGIPGKTALGIVDYAHTPDALEHVLSTLVELREDGLLIAVVGCGGDRDREKRPVMGRISTEYADRVIFTSDNPRSEDPVDIIEEMEQGVSPEKKKKLLKIPDRKVAIRTACQLGTVGDLILVSGKGHEKYQEIQGERRPFDDIEVLKSELFQDI